MPIVTGIALTHQFNAPLGWSSCEYGQGRQYHGFVYLMEGEATYLFIDGSKLQLKKGDCIYLPKGIRYRVDCPIDKPFNHMTVNFNLSQPDLLENQVIIKKLNNPGKFEQVFEKLIYTWNARKPYYQERCLGFLYELIYRLEKEVYVVSSPHYNRIFPAIHYIEEHFTDNFSIGQLAATCSVKPAYLRRLFMLVLQESPTEYIRRLRITMAKEFLASSNYSISQIAAFCGYDDETYFNRVFKKAVGITPAKYKSQSKAKL